MAFPTSQTARPYPLALCRRGLWGDCAHSRRRHAVRLGRTVLLGRHLGSRARQLLTLRGRHVEMVVGMTAVDGVWRRAPVSIVRCRWRTGAESEARWEDVRGNIVCCQGYQGVSFGETRRRVWRRRYVGQGLFNTLAGCCGGPRASPRRQELQTGLGQSMSRSINDDFFAGLCW